ncbi:MAG: DUF805 domain-containing protein [Actinomycetia bacterium]|nr:DUF805 domain-containing protein [Actinomycetes bacterium]
MPPLQAIRTVWSKYADFSGRAGRPEYWWWYLFVVVVQLALYVPGFFIAALAAPELNADGTTSQGGGIGILLYLLLWIAVLLALVIPSIAVLVRRLHDTERSGFWFFLGFVPFGSLVLLILCALPGDRGQNMYGPPPGVPAGFGPDLGAGPVGPMGPDNTPLGPGPAAPDTPAGSIPAAGAGAVSAGADAATGGASTVGVVGHPSAGPRPQWRQDLPRMPVPRSQLSPDVRDGVAPYQPTMPPPPDSGGAAPAPSGSATPPTDQPTS